MKKKVKVKKNKNKNNKIKENWKKDKKKRIQEMYNSTSYVEIYDNRYKKLQFDKVIKILKKIGPISGLILDFGTGTGLLSDFLYLDNEKKNNNNKNNVEIIKIKKGTPAINFIGIDLSARMLMKFKSKLEIQNDLIKSRHLICCDGENLPFRNKIFNFTFALTTLQNLPNPEEGLKEIKRTIKNSGNIGISFLRKSIEKKELLEILEKIVGKPSFLTKTNKNRLKYNEDWIFTI